MFNPCQGAIAHLIPTLAISLISFPLPPAIAQDTTLRQRLQQVNEVAAMLEGVMDTTAQARTNPKAPSVQMTTCRVTVESAALDRFKLPPATILLYQEQALTTKLTEPYRQRLLAIAPYAPETPVASVSFRFQQPAQLAGFCNLAIGQRRLPLTAIGDAVCTVYLQKTKTGYRGETPAQGCPANVRGAVRITNAIELTPAGMNTWDRGFNADGKQVWGAQAESYQFRRKE